MSDEFLVQVEDKAQRITTKLHKRDDRWERLWNATQTGAIASPIQGIPIEQRIAPTTLRGKVRHWLCGSTETALCPLCEKALNVDRLDPYAQGEYIRFHYRCDCGYEYARRDFFYWCG